MVMPIDPDVVSQQKNLNESRGWYKTTKYHKVSRGAQN